MSEHQEDGFNLHRPDDNLVIEEMFGALMRKRGWTILPDQAVNQMLSYPPEKKWTLIYQDRLIEWLSRDVYVSILSGCRWCTNIGNAVLTSSESDYWMQDWNGSRSDGASLGSLSDDEGMDLDSNSPNELSRSPAFGLDEDMGAGENGLGVEDATIAKEGASERLGFYTIKSLDCTAKLDINIEFLRWRGSPVFNLVRVTAEVTTPSQVEDGCLLGDMVDDNAVIMTLEIIMQDMIDGTSVFPRRWDIVSAADFDEWVPRATPWLRGCDEHIVCATSGTFQPTRLINVRNPDHPQLAVLSEDDDQSSVRPYAALSYVWGLKQEYVLTKAALEEMRTGLDLSRLPRTISDAIRAARRLGFDYLWVDALCIIQDSPEDKARELPLMSDTYRESSLCIVVASAAAASEGFLKAPESPRFLVDPFEVRVDSADVCCSPSLTFGYRAPYKASADPISSRAWTLQERVLSQRLLIFSRGGVMWMCRGCFINPGAAPDAGPPYQTSLGLHADGDENSGDQDTEASIRETWMAIRADYTEMDLTYCADKLPAISALAAEVGRQTGWTYLAGMWKDNLFSELHWRSTKRSPSGERLVLKPQKAKGAGYIAPSWSWASVGIGSVEESEDEHREIFDFTILTCYVDTDPAFPFGPVKGGYLQVSGKAVELAWQAEDRPEWDGFDISLLDPQEKASSTGTPLLVGDGTLDSLDENLDPGVKLVCLGMSKLKLGRQRVIPVEGLLLIPTGSSRGTFRRVGFFRMTAPSVFSGVPVSILRIE
ncbi:heterokaryon incompatibility protein-domain-containing protein [Lasiosphaeria hispida]|uniref:Heterokaryon incompatibility protein-domain-containing protein n=1 Tax=Lasiosphaeria hispida TaxID=260671 RepID=A0AAJ0MAA4_9PEZI|nr:heterokaryon incompatibility protein-domain-containing protein [Lasiosphaeria hispida]